MIGVAKSPPMTPTLVMEKVPPLRSARSRVRSRAALARAWISAAIVGDRFLVGELDHGHDQAVGDVHGDADVVVLLDDDLVLVLVEAWR